ncbi:MAG: GTP-binding protein [Mobilitalea sp.]
MTKIDIVSGFLGAGKTTLIKKLLEERVFPSERVVLIENEFGEIGIDGTLLKGYGIEIKEMNSGCICCTISGDFNQALKEMMKKYQPDRIIIEPSGVGKLSDVIKGCRQITPLKEIDLNICLTVIDGTKYNLYMKNFTEFYSDQLKHARSIIISRTQNMKHEVLESVQSDIRKYNKTAPIIVSDWDVLSGNDIIAICEHPEQYSLESDLINEITSSHKASKLSFKGMDRKISGSTLKKQQHADEVFSVWSKETHKIFDYPHLKEMLIKLDNLNTIVLRAKGIVRTDNNKWLQFDYVPGEYNIKETTADFTGRICLIAEHIREQELHEIFGI